MANTQGKRQQRGDRVRKCPEHNTGQIWNISCVSAWLNMSGAHVLITRPWLLLKWKCWRLLAISMLVHLNGYILPRLWHHDTNSPSYVMCCFSTVQRTCSSLKVSGNIKIAAVSLVAQEAQWSHDCLIPGRIKVICTFCGRTTGQRLPPGILGKTGRNCWVLVSSSLMWQRGGFVASS